MVVKMVTRNMTMVSTYRSAWGPAGRTSTTSAPLVVPIDVRLAIPRRERCAHLRVGAAKSWQESRPHHLSPPAHPYLILAHDAQKCAGFNLALG